MHKYTIDTELGHGFFGVTYKGRNKSTNEVVAIKTIDIAKSIEVHQNIDAIRKEISILNELSGFKHCYKYIACLYESFEDIFNGVQTMFIISEFIDGFTLKSFITNYKNIPEVTILWPITFQLIIGLKHIHTLGFAHRDIKPDNIMITKDNTIKYIDFGLSCFDGCLRRTGICDTCTSTFGATFYKSPEYFNGTWSGTIIGAKAHDIWSLGLVLLQLYNGIDIFPFDIRDTNGVQLNIKDIESNIEFAPQYKSDYKLDGGISNIFIMTLLTNDWKKRPKIDKLYDFFIEYIMTRPYKLS